MLGVATKTPSVILTYLNLVDIPNDNIPASSPMVAGTTSVAEQASSTLNVDWNTPTKPKSTKNIAFHATTTPIISNITPQSNLATKLVNPKYGEYCYLTFGVYPQKNDGSVEPILWKVLNCTSYSAKIISNSILFNCDIVPQGSSTWLSTDLYVFLNNTFVRDAFTDSERKSLIATDQGVITLLSVNDVKNSLMGFIDNTSREAIQTEYASKQKSKQNNAWWLLPDADVFQNKNSYIKSNGLISSIEKEVPLGVRPVCIIDLETLVISEGNGMFDDPYRMVDEK